MLRKMKCFQTALAASAVILSSLTQCTQAATTLIPATSFSSQSEFDRYWSTNYPWGTDHNGSARMSPSQVSLSNSTVTLRATRTYNQPQATHGGRPLDIRYLSGAVNAKEHFTTERGGGLDFKAELKATTTRGTWPAFWLTYVDGWPPEVDMAEWKGSGKISFNTFNTSSELMWKDVQYQDEAQFHAFRCEIRDVNGRDVNVKFFMDDDLIIEQWGGGYVGKAMYLSVLPPFYA